MNPRIRNVRKLLLSDNWYTLNKVVFDYQMPDGQWVEQMRESYDRGNGAAVLLYNLKKRTVILISQFRMPTYLNGNESGMMIEACAGLLDGDDPETCVIKEAEEESGFRVSKVEKIYEAYMSPGAVTEVVHLYIGEYEESDRVGAGGGLEEEHEDISVLELDFDKAIEMMENGKIRDAKTIILLQHLRLLGLMR
ncbi:GDP-mannose pyrophosphatase NudK [Lutimonas zeaxanthinifaciens]|uniref:GDP-mannose pyrophosphatase NudK n=1 Tax=Lutimonas zeaxanthinifaciens TaxID=3060215 RepID=UPI00265D3760|nr:GDP-mannose pyrophosphatase NudK [Lutimonas sp. YSD2104]WKK64990.1 GDP-mannose pyrophosphatase NudK [Lutimonas sp. YSD2104]